MNPAFTVQRVGSELRRRWRPMLVLAVGFAVAAGAIGAFRLTVQAAAGTVDALKKGAHVIAYLRDDVPVERVELLRQTVAKLPDVRQAALVTSDDALARLQHDMGDAHGLFDGVEQGFLPRSIEISLAPAPGVAANAQRLAVRLRTIEGVVDADVAVAHLERLTSWSALGRWSALGLLAFALLASLGAVSVGVWAIRGGRREEARVLHFLGMTRIEVVSPVVAASALAALVGCAAGLLMLFALWRGVVAGVLARFRDALGPYLGTAAFLPWRESLLALAAAGGLGMLAGVLAARFRPHHAVR